MGQLSTGVVAKAGVVEVEEKNSLQRRRWVWFRGPRGCSPYTELPTLGLLGQSPPGQSAVVAREERKGTTMR